MGFFSDIWDKIRHHASTTQASSGQPSSSQQQARQEPSVAQQQARAPAAAQAAATAVDVEAVLTQLARTKGGGGNWRESIVDLLKLLDLDSSLDARKGLAEELNVHAGAHGSAEQNIALHKAVMRKIAENGGKVPENLRR